MSNDYVHLEGKDGSKIRIKKAPRPEFIVANHEDVKQLQVKVNELEKRIEGLYDILEELLKKID